MPLTEHELLLSLIEAGASPRFAQRVRAAMETLPPAQRVGACSFCGGYWAMDRRQNFLHQWR
jgi:hypothetical protein